MTELKDVFQVAGHGPAKKGSTMRKVVLICLVFLAVSVSATAQQGDSPEVQALKNKLMQEINSNLQCGTQVFAVQSQLQVMTAERDNLKFELANTKDTVKTPPTAKK